MHEFRPYLARAYPSQLSFRYTADSSSVFIDTDTICMDTFDKTSARPDVDAALVAAVDWLDRELAAVPHPRTVRVSYAAGRMTDAQVAAWEAHLRVDPALLSGPSRYTTGTLAALLGAAGSYYAPAHLRAAAARHALTPLEALCNLVCDEDEAIAARAERHPAYATWAKEHGIPAFTVTLSHEETPVQLPETPVQLPETPVQLPETPVQLPETPVQLPETPVQLPETPVQLPRRGPQPRLLSPAALDALPSPSRVREAMRVISEVDGCSPSRAQARIEAAVRAGLLLSEGTGRTRRLSRP